MPFYHPVWMNFLATCLTAYPDSETISEILQTIFFHIPLFCLASSTIYDTIYTFLATTSTACSPCDTKGRHILKYKPFFESVTIQGQFLLPLTAIALCRNL